MIGTMTDTRPAAERVHIQLLRQAPAWRKLQLLGELNAAARALALSGLRQRHPDASPEELRQRLAELWLGPELSARVAERLRRMEQQRAN
jgi:hypothetical protein